MKKKEQTIEEAIDEVWEKLFDLICDKHDSIYELKIIYQEDATGKTITRSYRDSQERLQQIELDGRKMDSSKILESLRKSVIKYKNPTDPVGDKDWEANK